MGFLDTDRTFTKRENKQIFKIVKQLNININRPIWHNIIYCLYTAQPKRIFNVYVASLVLIKRDRIGCY